MNPNPDPPAPRPRRTVTFMGVEIPVIDEQTLMEETCGTGEHYQVCLRVDDESPEQRAWLRRVMPNTLRRRFKTRCATCRELVWLDPRASPAPGLGTPICTVCLIAEAKARKARKEQLDGQQPHHLRPQDGPLPPPSAGPPPP